MSAEAEQRVQGRGGGLRNEPNAAAAQGAHLLFRQREQVLACETKGPGERAAAKSKQSQEGEGDGTLA